MRTMLTILISLFSGIASYSQVNQINIVNGKSDSKSTTSEATYVNGVPMSEDIGGVDITYEQSAKFVRTFTDCYYRDRHREEYDNLSVKLTNYNNFAVTVYYEFGYECLIPRELEGRGEWTHWFVRYKKETGKTVLPPATEKSYPSRYIGSIGDAVIISVLELSTVTKRLSNQ